MTEQEAIELAKSNWWTKATDEQIVAFQLFEPRLCMPFGRFHEAVNKVLERPVYTHEFGLDVEGLRAEFKKKRPPATLADVLALIPEKKRVLGVIK